MQQAIDLIWLRNDLRLLDNPALYAGSERECLILFTEDGVDVQQLGAASRVFLHHSLQAFSVLLLEQFQVRLILGANLLQRVDALRSEFRIGKVFWNRSYEPGRMGRDSEIETQLRARGLQPVICPGSVLFEPSEIKNKSGKAFRVFTPYYRTVLSFGEPMPPLPKPKQILCPRLAPEAYGRLEDMALLPRAPRWDESMMSGWRASEPTALQLLKTFLKVGVDAYPDSRDCPAEMGTSRLSPYLHFGQITPRTIWEWARKHRSVGCEVFLRQIVWREFAIYSLFHQPQMDRLPILKQFEKFPWLDEPDHLRAWQRGLTGYPIVDAGMRELWHTGWMHNRVRMIVGSFLVKNLHIHWLRGAEWFWETLVDADRANNSMGWQWVAGCGIDPSPYFRIFNPMLQGEKYDPEGLYIKRWIPELNLLPKAWLQKPWEAPQSVLDKAGIRLGRDYPQPLVDYAESRQLALMFYDRIKFKAESNRI